MQVNKIIAQWREDLLIPNQKDVLVRLAEGKNALHVQTGIGEQNTFILPSTPLLKRIVRSNEKNKRESGVKTLGLAQKCLIFTLEDKNYYTPLFITNCSAKFSRFTQEYTINREGQRYFNPFLNKLLETSFDREEEEEIVAEIRRLGIDFSVDDTYYLANFHPHRFTLLKEIEALAKSKKLNQNVDELLTNEKTTPVELPLHEGLLFPADFDQNRLFRNLQQQNLVLQGPPGTGKSQVISNLLGKTMANWQSTLVVAEKQVALQVLQEQLKKRDLDHFCLLFHHQTENKTLIQSIKKSWEFLEQTQAPKRTFYTRSDLMLKQFQLTIDRLRGGTRIGGLSYSDFFNRFKKVGTQKEHNLSFSTAQLPEIPQWEKDKLELEKISSLLFKPSNKAILQLKNLDSEKGVEDFISSLKKIQNEVEKLKNKTFTWGDISSLMRSSALAECFFYNGEVLPNQLFDPESSHQTAFLKIYNEYISTLEEIELLTPEKENWKKELSLSELVDFAEALKSTNRLSWKNWKKKKALLRFSKLDLNASKFALQQLIHLKELEKKKRHLRKEFRKKKLPDDTISLKQVYFLIKRSQQWDTNELKKLVKLSPEELRQRRDNHQILEKLKRFEKNYLLNVSDESVAKTVDNIEEALSFLRTHFITIQAISSETKVILRKAGDLYLTEKIIFSEHFKRFSGLFPELAQLTGDQLYQKVDTIVSQQEEEQIDFAKYIMGQLKAQFEEYHQLLQTPARKLSQEKKKLKVKLRKGKSILVKAFARKRSHPSLLELLSSDASIWIYLLKPVFLTSPSAVAKNLPLNAKEFDCVIFDEASQTPLPHAVGSIHRGRRILVAGDTQQMAPSFYFQSKATPAVDLLHQATYYWKNNGLTHHYRSDHPHLIAFSNRYFYENKLQPFPAFSAKDPIELIHLDGNYENRVNVIEADYAAKWITKKIKEKQLDFGLVTFSQIQLGAIIDRLEPKYQEILLDEKNNILCQSLENVQGEQCNHLLICMGYAKNKEGSFSMQFGPLNKENGFRRLNVMMSRARKKITFIRSVAAKDFRISDNDGVDLLRKLMLFLEEQNQYELKFPFGLKPTIKKSELAFFSLHEKIANAEKWLTLHRVLSERNWELNYRIKDKLD